LIYGQGVGDDELEGGWGDDTIWGGDGSDLIFGDDYLSPVTPLIDENYGFDRAYSFDDGK